MISSLGVHIAGESAGAVTRVIGVKVDDGGAGTSKCGLSKSMAFIVDDKTFTMSVAHIVLLRFTVIHDVWIDMWYW